MTTYPNKQQQQHSHNQQHDYDPRNEPRNYSIGQRSVQSNAQHQSTPQHLSMHQIQGYSLEEHGHDQLHSHHQRPQRQQQQQHHNIAQANFDEGRRDDFTRSSSRNASSGKRKRKIEDNYGKPSNRRFVWPEQKHREFVSALFDVGLKSSTPSLIIGAMQSANTFSPEMTTERIKSHLQKFRVNRVKSKEDFLRSYEACKKDLDEGAQRNEDIEPEEGTEEGGREEGGAGGSVVNESKEEAEEDMVSAANAAKATYGSIHFPEEEFLRSSSRSELLSQAGPGQLQAATIKGDIWGVRGIGDLTENEKSSRVGVAIVHMAKAMEELRDEVLKNRALEEMGGETGMTKEEGKATKKSKGGGRGLYRQDDISMMEQQHNRQHALPQYHQEVINNPYSNPLSAPPISVIPHLPEAAKNLNHDLNNIPNPTLPSSLSISMRTHLEIQDKMRKVKQDEITKWSSNGSGRMSSAGSLQHHRAPQIGQEGMVGQRAGNKAHSKSRNNIAPIVAPAYPPFAGNEAEHQPATPLLSAAASDLLFPGGTAWDADMDDNIFEFLEGMVDVGTEDADQEEGF